MRIRVPAVLICAVAVVATPRSAAADITAFLGASTAPVNRLVRGASLGVGLVIVGFEFEFADTKEEAVEAAPRLRTYMFNGLLQTPIPIAGMQFYATAGGGVYRESLGEDSETHVGVNIGGGVKVSLAGPLRLRVDYRVFTLRGDPRHARPQRVYAGINLAF